jgi:hypothetical protein
VVHTSFGELNGVRHAVVEYEQTVEARRDSLIECRTPRRLMLSGFEVVFFVPDQCLASDGSAVVFCQRINVSKPPAGGTVMLALPPTIDIEAEITLSGGGHSLGCFVPDFAGAFLSSDSKDALWARFYTGAPQRQRRSVERYNIVKSA